MPGMLIYAVVACRAMASPGVAVVVVAVAAEGAVGVDWIGFPLRRDSAGPILFFGR